MLEHTLAMETAAMVGVTVSGGTAGDTDSMTGTLPQTAENLEQLAETTGLGEGTGGRQGLSQHGTDARHL